MILINPNKLACYIVSEKNLLHNRPRLISDPEQMVDELIELKMLGVSNDRNKLSEVFIPESLEELMDRWPSFWLVSNARLYGFCMLTVLLIFCEVFGQAVGFCH